MAGYSYTREQWARALLHYLGNDNPSQSTVDFVVKWTGGETYGPGGSGLNNLLNTTQWAPGASSFAGLSVKNYPTFTEGVKANVTALRNGLYPALERALRTNNINALLHDAEVRREIQHVWGTSTWNPSLQGGVSGRQSFPEGTPGKGDIPTAQPQGAFSFVPHRAPFGHPAGQSIVPHVSPGHTDLFGQPYTMSIPRQPAVPVRQPKPTRPSSSRGKRQQGRPF